VTSRSDRGRWERVLAARRQAQEALSGDWRGDGAATPPKARTALPEPTGPKWTGLAPYERSERVLSLGGAASYKPREIGSDDRGPSGRVSAGGPDADGPDARSGPAYGGSHQNSLARIAMDTDGRCSPIPTNSNRARYPVLMEDETSDPQLNGPRASSETSRAWRALDPGRRTRLRWINHRPGSLPLLPRWTA